MGEPVVQWIMLLTLDHQNDLTLKMTSFRKIIHFITTHMKSSL